MTSSLAAAAQYLTFQLDDEVYATEIAQVREVLEFSRITKVPRTPPYMRGVINLRGHVVPVLDLKLRFGLRATDQTVSTCIIIVEVQVDGERTVIGALADSVQEVIEMDPAAIQPPPRIGTRLNTEFIRGMGKRDEHFVILLDLDRIFAAGDILEAANVAANALETAEA